MVSPTDILGAISDDRSLLLFNAIALSNSESSDILATRLNLTRKQYYSRMSELVRTNLVNRRNGKYFLTSLGKIVYDVQTTIRKAIADYWKLKAIDELELEDRGEMPKEEYNKIINSLIDNEKIKEGSKMQAT
jgi:predicted transcriptional regulator